MKIYHSLDYVSEGPVSVALGCFDGVHRGHVEVIQTAVFHGKRLEIPCLVWAFAEPPRNFFAPQSVPLITDEETKAELIADLGADTLVSIPFDKQIASLSAEDFLETVLKKQLSARHIVCGFNYTFGAGGIGNVTLLRQFCEKNKIGLTIAEPVVDSFGPVSSSLIRESISMGQTEKTIALLGRPYSITAEVVDGQKLARNLGFPTMNQLIPSGMAVPRYGVYVSRIRGLSKLCYGITNVGTRPTVNGNLLCAETHIFDFHGDLYGQKLTVDLLSFLREETPFPSLEALTEQVLRDIENAKQYLKQNDHHA